MIQIYEMVQKSNYRKQINSAKKTSSEVKHSAAQKSSISSTGAPTLRAPSSCRIRVRRRSRSGGRNDTHWAHATDRNAAQSRRFAQAESPCRSAACSRRWWTRATGSSVRCRWGGHRTHNADGCLRTPSSDGSAELRAGGWAPHSWRAEPRRSCRSGVRGRCATRARTLTRRVKLGFRSCCCNRVIGLPSPIQRSRLRKNVPAFCVRVSRRLIEKERRIDIRDEVVQLFLRHLGGSWIGHRHDRPSISRGRSSLCSAGGFARRVARRDVCCSDCSGIGGSSSEIDQHPRQWIIIVTCSSLKVLVEKRLLLAWTRCRDRDRMTWPCRESARSWTIKRPVIIGNRSRSGGPSEWLNSTWMRGSRARSRGGIDTRTCKCCRLTRLVAGCKLRKTALRPTHRRWGTGVGRGFRSPLERASL